MEGIYILGIVMVVIGFINLIFTIKTYRLTNSKSEGKKITETADLNFTEIDLQEEVELTTFLKMYAVRNSVQKQLNGIHVKSIEFAPKSLGIKKEIVEKSFPSEKIQLIETFWNLFNEYVETYWKNKNRGYKTVFAGDIDKKTGDVGVLLQASEELVIKLDQIIEEMNRSL